MAYRFPNPEGFVLSDDLDPDDIERVEDHDGLILILTKSDSPHSVTEDELADHLRWVHEQWYPTCTGGCGFPVHEA
jgi:hypothetical protein